MDWLVPQSFQGPERLASLPPCSQPWPTSHADGRATHSRVREIRLDLFICLVFECTQNTRGRNQHTKKSPFPFPAPRIPAAAAYLKDDSYNLKTLPEIFYAYEHTCMHMCLCICRVYLPHLPYGSMPSMLQDTLKH